MFSTLYLEFQNLALIGEGGGVLHDTDLFKNILRKVENYHIPSISC